MKILRTVEILIAMVCSSALWSPAELPVEVSLFKIPRALEAIEAESGHLHEVLMELPSIQEPLQLDAYGYHGGYLPALEELPDEPRWTVELQFSKYAKFEQIIVVPAIDRSTTPIRSYGFPKRFRVLQIFESGKRVMVKEWLEEDCPDPGRVPLILDVKGQGASRLVIEVFRGSQKRGQEFFALDEVFGMVKAWPWQAISIEVSSELASPPYWGKQYLIDRKTSLGLPVGRMDTGKPERGDFTVVFGEQPQGDCYIELDLGASHQIGEITLFPAVPSEGVLIPGYGFPGKIEVRRQIEKEDGSTGRITITKDGWEEGNPGNNPVLLSVKKYARWIRIYPDELPMIDGRAVFAMGEILVHESDKHYPIRSIRLVGFPEPIHSEVSLLFDGKANGRPVMILQDWLEKMEKRSRLENELAALADAEAYLKRRWSRFWRNTGLSAVLLLLVSALSIAFMALIQRRRNQQEMNRKVEEEHRRTELEQMKIRFFTHISHELRTPLTVILGPLEKMLDRISEPALAEQALLMHRNVKKLQGLVDQLLDFRKLQEGQAVFEWSSLDLIEHIKNGFNIFRSLATDRHINYHLDIPDEELRVLLDSGKFQKISDNLISNALKYTPEYGTVRVSLRVLRNAEGQPECMLFIVEDNGAGIAAEDLAHVFEQFYRAEGLQPVKAAGSGIGLSLVKELVDRWGGSITVESPVENGRGTRFRVQLPITLSDETGPPAETAPAADEPYPAREPGPPPEAVAGKPKILLVEDDDDIRTFTGAELEAMYHVEQASDGREGLEKALNGLPELVVTDVMMPEMDGIALCRRLKTDGKTSHIPVIMLTARGSEEHQLEGLETGADDYVTKPYSMPLLKARIQNLLASRRMLRERFAKELSVEPGAITVTSMDEELLRRAIGVVEEHMDDLDFNVEQFASEMHMARNTLLLKLKALVDQTPQAFIRTLRLKRARQLLEQNAGTVAEVAFQVGFDEPSNFSRSFKKQFGTTPSAFVKSIRATND